MSSTATACPTRSRRDLGVGQGVHTHQLLKAGELALERLLPGITQDFIAAGAVAMRVGRDVKVYDFGGWMDDCDAGFTVTSLSRPAYEGVLRHRVVALPNVTLSGRDARPPLCHRRWPMHGRRTGRWRACWPPTSSSTPPA